jgi:simple sugar transport system substrate-binding protein
VLWNFTNVDKAIIGDVEHGTFGTHGYNLTLGNGGISLLQTKYISSSVWSQIMTADKAIIAGTIKVPKATTDAAAKKLLKAS